MQNNFLRKNGNLILLVGLNSLQTKKMIAEKTF